MNAVTTAPTSPLRALAGRLRTVFSIDLRSLALFRVMLALVVLADLALRSADLAAFYTDAGVLPRRDLLSIGHRWYWSIHTASGELWWQVVLFALAAAFALALLVGYRTRLASIGTFVLVASLLNRNPLVLQGGDQLLAVICFWAMFLPLGARRSVDAALEPALRRSPNVPRHRPGEPQPHFSVATIAVIFQVLYLYTFTAFLKTGDAWTTRFDAAYYAVSLQHFSTPIGAWFSTFPPLLLKMATVFVLVGRVRRPPARAAAAVLAAPAPPRARASRLPARRVRTDAAHRPVPADRPDLARAAAPPASRGAGCSRGTSPPARHARASSSTTTATAASA